MKKINVHSYVEKTYCGHVDRSQRTSELLACRMEEESFAGLHLASLASRIVEPSSYAPIFSYLD